MSKNKIEKVISQPDPSPNKNKVRLRVNQKDMKTSYANSFRPITSADEVFLDFGINQTIAVNDAKEDEVQTEIIFDATERIILNYATVKRLGIALSQVVQRYESEFGEIKLNVADRRVKK